MTNQVETEQWTFSTRDVADKILGLSERYRNIRREELDFCEAYLELLGKEGYKKWHGNLGKEFGDFVFQKLGQEFPFPFEAEQEMIIAGLIDRGVFEKKGILIRYDQMLPRYLLDKALSCCISRKQEYIKERHRNMIYWGEGYGLESERIESKMVSQREELRGMLRAKNGTPGNPERR